MPNRVYKHPDSKVWDVKILDAVLNIVTMRLDCNDLKLHVLYADVTLLNIYITITKFKLATT